MVPNFCHLPTIFLVESGIKTMTCCCCQLVLHLNVYLPLFCYCVQCVICWSAKSCISFNLVWKSVKYSMTVLPAGCGNGSTLVQVSVISDNGFTRILSRPITIRKGLTLPARLQMSTLAGPIISVISVRTTVSCHNSSSSASSNPRRSRLPAYKDCHIWFTCLRSFWSHMLECTTTISKVTVVETRTVLWFTEDNPHGAAVVTFVTRFARGLILFINININILLLTL